MIDVCEEMGKPTYSLSGSGGSLEPQKEDNVNLILVTSHNDEIFLRSITEDMFDCVVVVLIVNYYF